MRKNFKNLLLLFVMFAMSMGTFAQSRFSINLGYANTIKRSVVELPLIKDEKTNEAISGITAGVAYDLMFTEAIGLNLGLDYTFSSNKIELNIPLMEGDKFTGVRSNWHTLDLPVRFLIAIPIAANSKFLVYGGPKFAFDMAGTNSLYLNGEKKESWNMYGESKLEGFEDIKKMVDEDPTRFNILLGPGIGFTYKSLVVKGGYDFGMLDMSKLESVKIRKDQWYITIGFAF